jgi:hypothetical protein
MGVSGTDAPAAKEFRKQTPRSGMPKSVETETATAETPQSCVLLDGLCSESGNTAFRDRSPFCRNCENISGASGTRTGSNVDRSSLCYPNAALCGCSRAGFPAHERVFEFFDPTIFGQPFD